MAVTQVVEAQSPVAPVPAVDLNPAIKASILDDSQFDALCALLAETLGPIARVLVKKTVSKSSSHTALIQGLADELDENERSAFTAAAQAIVNHRLL